MSVTRILAAILAALTLASCAAQSVSDAPALPMPPAISSSASGSAASPLSEAGAHSLGAYPSVPDSVLRAGDPLAGDGTVIAVIDTGFDLTHEAFAMPDGAKERIAADGFVDFIYDTNAASLAANAYGSTDILPDLYRTEKIPLAFDYAGRDTDVSGGNDAHGTHVAALAAAFSEGGKLTGAAPAAQLLLMKVFADDGTTCRETDIVSAVEDAVRLGADVINLSLGTLSLSEDFLAMETLARTLRYAESEGVVIVCAVGNDGFSGIGGLHSDTMRADNPDTALVSEPAILPETIAVGAATNTVEYAPTLIAGDREITYTTSLECEEGKVPSFTAVLGGRELPLAHVDGVGTKADFAAVDCAGKIVLVRRGEISFEEKITNAEKAGALGVIVYNTKGAAAIVMTVGDAKLPAVSVTYEDGAYLASLAGESVRIPAAADQFSPVKSPVSAADFSSRGPTDSLTLAPDLLAPGTDVLSAVPGGYGVLSGTSMASPQIAGLAASYLSLYGDQYEKEERAAAVRAALMSSAAVLTDEDGVPVSPRAQGAGLIAKGVSAADMTVSVLSQNGMARVSLGGDMLDKTGIFSFTVTVHNHGRNPETLTPHLSVITEGAEEKDGVWYTTNTSVRVPAAVTFDTDSLTVAPGASEALTVTVTPDPDFLSENGRIWENGFFLEGFLTLVNADGDPAASIPYVGFCGDFTAAPILDGGDWDGFESFYGGQFLYLRNDRGTMRPAGSASSLFAFSPNGDGAGERVFFRIYPLRHISRVLISVTDADGESVYTSSHGSAPKTYMSDDGLTYAELFLWDGTDGDNDRYHFPDGQYTVTAVFYSYTGAVQTLEIPLSVDTAAPTLTVTGEDGVLEAEAADGEMLYSLRIYAPNTENIENPYLLDTSVTETKKTLHLRTKIPAEAEYVYVRAEDCAGNVTIVRYYPESGKEG